MRRHYCKTIQCRQSTSTTCARCCACSRSRRDLRFDLARRTDLPASPPSVFEMHVAQTASAVWVEAYLAEGSAQAKERTSYHLLLLVENEIGYGNLLKRSTLAQLEGYYYRPRIDLEMLSRQGNWDSQH